MVKYDVVLADPPWFYERTSTYNRTGASSHYALFSDAEMLAFDVRRFMAERSALFLWATCPRLDFAIRCLAAWGLTYRGVAFVWVKTNASNGKIMGAKGPPPAFVKPVTELVIVATTVQVGRVWPVLDMTVGQVVLANRREHSRKPDEVADRIVALCGDRPRIELFARQRRPGWDAWGAEVA